MTENQPLYTIEQLDYKVKQLEKRIEEVREELLIEIGQFQANMTLFIEELTRLKRK